MSVRDLARVLQLPQTTVSNVLANLSSNVSDAETAKMLLDNMDDYIGEEDRGSLEVAIHIARYSEVNRMRSPIPPSETGDGAFTLSQQDIMAVKTLTGWTGKQLADAAGRSIAWANKVTSPDGHLCLDPIDLARLRSVATQAIRELHGVDTSKSLDAFLALVPIPVSHTRTFDQTR